MSELIDDLNGDELKPIRDQIYEILRRKIFTSQYNVGKKLIENEIAKQMNVSRTPVREAFRKLEIEGLVEHKPRKGVFVKGLDRSDITEIYSIRSVLEGLAAKNAAKNINDEELKKFKTIISKMKTAIKLDDSELFKRSCIEFNDVIRNASKMPRLHKMISQLKEYTQETREITLSDKNRRRKVVKEHEAIFKAIYNNDSEKAEAVTKEHLEKAKNKFLEATKG